MKLKLQKKNPEWNCGVTNDVSFKWEKACFYNQTPILSPLFINFFESHICCQDGT